MPPQPHTQQGGAENSPLLDDKILADAKRLLGEKFAYAVKMFLADTAEASQGIAQATTATEVGRRAHALKSTSGYMGALRLMSEARALEHACLNVAQGKGGQGTVEELKLSLQNTLAQTQTALRRKYPDIG